MAAVKVAALGAGSYVFGPSVLNDAILQHGLADVELALMDVDGEVVELMAAIGRRMAREKGLATKVTAHTSRDTALDGASFVVCSAARQLQRRFATDCEIIDKYAPGHIVTEFGGVQGISYSLRQIALIQEIAADMHKYCPRAWLLDAANPLPRVAQAAHEEGVKVAGFCSASLGGYSRLWMVFHGASVTYPFQQPRDAYDARMGGLNHFSWLLALKDKATGADLMPELRRRIASGATTHQPVCERLFKELGYLITVGDDHSRDFLAPSAETSSRREASHGSPEIRQQRLKLMRQIADGSEKWDELIAHPSWERPIDLVAAMAFGKPAAFPSLNLINDRGQIPQLPRNVFVETPCRGSKEGPTPERIDLPEAIVPLCRAAAQVTDTIVRAARQRSVKLVREALELDPTVVDKAAGWRALQESMAAHSDILPKYS